MGSLKGSTSQTSTSSQSQRTSPISYLGTDTKNALTDATSLYNAGAPKYYSGNTFAGFSPEQQAAMSGTVQLASDGSPIVKDAQSAIGSMLTTPSGTNPFLDKYLSTLGAQTANGINNTFNANGRFGSGSNASTAATAVTNAQLPFLMDQYNKDQSNKLTAAGMAPALSDYDFTNLARIGTVGDAKQAMDQAGITDKVNAYNYNSQAPENYLNNYLNQLNASDANNWGTTTANSTQTQKSQSGSPLGSILGAGLTLASMFSGAGPLAALGSSMGMSAGSGIGSMLAGIGGAGGMGGLSGLLSMIPGAFGRGVTSGATTSPDEFQWLGTQ